MAFQSQLPMTPRAFLVAHNREVQARVWPHPLPTAGIWKVTGQAGSGVSSFLLDTVISAIERGVDPRGIVIVTSSKESGARLRVELSDRLAASGFVTDEPMVRSIHSLAFALLRQESQDQIRLISGAEQDAVIRQLLEGHSIDGTGTWPVELRPALPMVGFARQLRDFLLRAVERQLTPGGLRELGRAHHREVWTAAGDFLHEYQQVTALSGARSYSASELVANVLTGPIPDRWHTVIVDDAQHLSPSAGELVRRLLQRATLGVVGGDVEQSVYHFRGASPKFFRELGGLTYDKINLGAPKRAPELSAMICDCASTHNAAITDSLRRAHLEDDVAYSDMAVIVRSTSLIEPIRRSLLQAGVPVSLNPTDLVLSEQRVVAALMYGLRALHQHLTVAEWRDLLLGPVGGTDPVTLRRLLRGLRRWAPQDRAEETLRDLLVRRGGLPDFGTVLTDRELDILVHVREILDAGRQAQDGGGSVEEILWAVWNATGLANRLLATALRGGATGSQADRDLDSVMALFDAAGDFTERRASAGIDSFVNYINEQVLPTGVRDRRTATPDAVALLTAHSAAGRQFRRVIVAGVQELNWPSLGETGSIFGQEDLIDLLDNGVDPAVPVSRKTERLIEERRLFSVATSRATESLLVTAIDEPDGEEVVQPSRFVQDFCREHDITARHVSLTEANVEASADPDAALEPLVMRVLAHDDLIAELRRALNGPTSSEVMREQAARQLARLASAGVPGADPAQWWTTTSVSTTQALPVPQRLSPSRIESLLKCPMREVLQRMTGLDSSLHMVWGSMAHAYFEAVGRGADEPSARRAVTEARRSVDTSPAWKIEREIADFEAMLGRSHQWLESSRSAFEHAAVEATIDVEILPGLSIVGRADRLEREESGLVHIVDLKTSAQAVGKQEANDNVQLEAYQLAISRGELHGDSVVTVQAGHDPLAVGGAVLVYPNHTKSTLAVREQAPKNAEQLTQFAALVAPLPAAMAGPELRAKTGAHCDQCAVRALCPLQPEGQVIYHG